MDRLRIVQWTTGRVGTKALEAVLDDSRLELVGLYAHSEDKAGVDAGVLAGRAPCGILATPDIDELIALAPNAVVYTPFMADLGQVERILGAGINVVSTNLFLNCGGMTGETRERIEAACARGSSSFWITGVNPGWINSVAAAMTAVCRRVDSVTIAESTDVSNYASRETWEAMGMGHTGADSAVLGTARGAMVSFRDAALRIAEALDFVPDEIDFEIEYARVPEQVDLGFMVLPAGSHGALRSAWVGKNEGTERVRVSVAWYLTRNLIEDWCFDDEHYHLRVEGDPAIDCRIELEAPHWQDSDWSVLTALPAVNAVAKVVAARPGILGLDDVGLVTTPLGNGSNNCHA
jgi:2,4-diaminopentanoate dehydrogenase